MKYQIMEFLASDISVKGVFELCKPEDKIAAPVLCDSPHSGTLFPQDFHFSCTPTDLLKFSDLYVDEIISDFRQSGITTLTAEFPRTYVDVNRRADDIDLLLLNDIWNGPVTSKGRAASGYGVVYRKAHKGCDIYSEKLSSQIIRQRLAAYYETYHTILEKTLNDLRQRFGFVLHLNSHSMPSTYAFQKLPDIILGDLNNTTCSTNITEYARNIFESNGFSVGVNYPYKGAEILRRYGKPHKGIHCLQIEINRSLYMHEGTLLKKAEFNNIIRSLSFVVNRLKESIILESEKRVAD